MTKQDLISTAKYMGLSYHHSAMQRGYVRKGHGWIEDYKGRFGEGVVLHIPNCESYISNSYHYIYYYTKEEKK